MLNIKKTSIETKDFLKLKEVLDEEDLTPSVLQWFDTIEAKENETIEEGLILEFSDVMEHPADPQIWKRFIDSLNYLIRTEPAYAKEIAPVALLQQLKLEITPRLDAPMAVSLLSTKQLIQRKPKYKIKQKPLLLINPLVLFMMLIRDHHDDFTNTDKLFKHVLFILIHETYHVSRGDLILNVKSHYGSKKVAEEYELAMQKKPIIFNNDEQDPITSNEPIKRGFPTNDIFSLNNILMDASINETIVNHIDSGLIKKESLENNVSRLSVAKSFERAINSDYDINSVDDFFDDNIPVYKKQYAVLDKHVKDTKDLPIPPAKSNSKNNNSQDGGEQNDSGSSSGSNTPDENEDGSGNGGSDDEQNENGNISKGDILKKHSDLNENQSEEERDDVVADVENLINTSNNAASEESNGKSFNIEPSNGLRLKILERHKAKALPKFEFKVKGIIKDFNTMKKLNYNLRHIAYQKRLDICRTQKIPFDAGFHSYLDVSGSVTDEVINNIYNVLIATTKDEPTYLYLFASGMSSKPLEIKRNTPYEEVEDFIQNEDVGFGTQFCHLLDNIAEHNNEKHIIFSDYCFSDDEFTKEHAESFKETPIIHVLEDKHITSEYCTFLQYASENKKFNKILYLPDYTL